MLAVAVGKLAVNVCAEAGIAVVHCAHATAMRAPFEPDPCIASIFADHALKPVIGVNDIVPDAGFIARNIATTSPTFQSITGAVTDCDVLEVLLVAVPSLVTIGYGEYSVAHPSPVDVETAKPDIVSTRVIVPLPS